MLCSSVCVALATFWLVRMCVCGKLPCRPYDFIRIYCRLCVRKPVLSVYFCLIYEHVSDFVQNLWTISCCSRNVACKACSATGRPSVAGKPAFWWRGARVCGQRGCAWSATKFQPRCLTMQICQLRVPVQRIACPVTAFQDRSDGRSAAARAKPGNCDTDCAGDGRSAMSITTMRANVAVFKKALFKTSADALHMFTFIYNFFFTQSMTPSPFFLCMI